MPEANPFKVRHVLCCEQVRMESSGKEILIGVYGHSIILREFPGTLPGLIFRIETDLRARAKGTFTCTFVAPDGSSAGSTSGILDAGKTPPGEFGIMHVPIADIKLPKPGVYKLILQYGGSRAAEIFRIPVREHRPGDPEFPPTPRPSLNQAPVQQMPGRRKNVRRSDRRRRA
ncbi:MAG: DUF6941 family protein [Pseudomonadota bacterium]